MSETLFAFDHGNYRECQHSYRGARNQEYYLGEYAIEANPVIEVKADRKTVGCCSIIRLRSRNRLFFRRSWSHIREDATDVTVLWFVKRGQLSISHQSGRSFARAGDFAVTKSMSAFFIECETDDHATHEVFHTVIPTHFLKRYIQDEVRMGFHTAADAIQFSIAERMLTEVFEDSGAISERSAGLMVGSALSVLNDALASRDFGRPARKSMRERRLEEALRFIETHYCDPGLTLATVAEACGISNRYLSYLLELHGSAFSRIVWDKRLSAAKEWLSLPGSRDLCIADIAHRAGFKSPAHFSRMFRRAFDMSPRDCRVAGGR